MKLKRRIKNIITAIKINANNEVDKRLESLGFISIQNTNEDDIFIAGYPKSGNTWVQNLISGLIYGIDTSLLPDKLTQELVPDVHVKAYYKRFDKLNFFKTHELPKKSMRRVIHLIRDGRDVMASYYAMNLALGKQSTLKEMIISGNDIYPTKWHEHTSQWLNNPYKADILILRYEDLMDDPVTQLKRVMDFSGIKRDDDLIFRVIQGNSISEMQRKEKDFGWNNKEWNPNENFIRKGKRGSYLNEIPKELIEFFEKEAYAELKRFNYLTE